MGGDGRKGGRKRNKRKKGKRGSAEPATIVVDLHLDLRGLTVLAEGTGGGPVRTAAAIGGATPADALSEPKVATLAGTVEPTTGLDDAAGSARAGRTDEVVVAGPRGPVWPLGPHYLRWVEGKGADAWARFKLRAADWYLEALEVAEREVGLDRFVGVEMAIDGVLFSLCAGIDAAAQALLDEVERFAGPSPLRAHRPVGEDWTVLVALAEGAGVELASGRAIHLAVRGDEEDADGWLTELQRLRALAVRRNVLVRRPNIDGAARSRLLDVPGLGQRPVLRYLRRARRRADALVEAMLADLDSLARERARPSPRPGLGRAVLPDLSARADVLGARWHGWEAR